MFPSQKKKLYKYTTQMTTLLRSLAYLFKETTRSQVWLTPRSLVVLDQNVPARSANCSTWARMMMCVSMLWDAHCRQRKVGYMLNFMTNFLLKTNILFHHDINCGDIYEITTKMIIPFFASFHTGLSTVTQPLPETNCNGYK